MQDAILFFLYLFILILVPLNPYVCRLNESQYEVSVHPDQPPVISKEGLMIRKLPLLTGSPLG